jgi:hypothetical protein
MFFCIHFLFFICINTKKFDIYIYEYKYMQRFQFKKEKNYDLVFVVIKNIYEVSNSFFSNIIYTYIDVCINTVVATIIAAYHQTNDEYMTGSFNERSRVTYKGALSLSLSHTYTRSFSSCFTLSFTLTFCNVLDCLWKREMRQELMKWWTIFFFHLSFGRFCFLCNHAATFFLEFLSNV